MLTLWLSLALAAPRCYTELELRKQICWAVCRHDGYDAGTYVKGKCRCGIDRDFKTLVDPKIVILSAPNEY